MTLSTYDGAPTTNDILILALIKSSDLLEDIEFWTDGGGEGGALNVGLCTADMTNNAISLAIVNVDLFASAQATGTPIAYDARISLFDEAATLDDVMDRGKTLWALAALGGTSYTEDPGKTFAICAFPSTTVDAANEMGFRVSYVAGD